MTALRARFRYMHLHTHLVRLIVSTTHHRVFALLGKIEKSNIVKPSLGSSKSGDLRLRRRTPAERASPGARASERGCVSKRRRTQAEAHASVRGGAVERRGIGAETPPLLPLFWAPSLTSLMPCERERLWLKCFINSISTSCGCS